MMRGESWIVLPAEQRYEARWRNVQALVGSRFLPARSYLLGHPQNLHLVRSVEAILAMYSADTVTHQQWSIFLALHCAARCDEISCQHACQSRAGASQAIYSPKMRFYDANVLPTHGSQHSGGEPVARQPRPARSSRHRQVRKQASSLAGWGSS